MARNNTIAGALLLTIAVAGCGGNASDNDGRFSGPGTDDGGGSGGGSGTTDPSANVNPSYPLAHPRIYLTPNRARLTAALAAGTPAATRFKGKVDAWTGGEDIWGFHAWNAALVGQLTSQPQYCVAAVAAVETQVAAAQAAIADGGAPVVANDSYLDIGESIGDVALVYDWCFDQVSSSQRQRWIEYANQAVWNVWHHADARWGSSSFPWSGWSVDNPSNNYYYSFLRATMLLGLATYNENPAAEDMLTQFRDGKILGELVPTFDADLVGGASREGTGYGVSMRRLFELYDFWRSTTGEGLAYKTPHTRASFVAFMHQIVPTLDKVAPTGDHARDATAALFDYHRDYLEELMRLFPADPMAARAKSLLAESSVPKMSSGFMAVWDFLNDSTDITAAPLASMNTAYYAEGIGQMYARSSWDKDATWMNLTAGPYTESHAHQDQGALMIYKGGWLMADANIGSHSGLSQATTSHSLVRIDQDGTPVRQIADTMSAMEGVQQGAGFVYAAGDVTAAYDGNGAVQQVQRETVFLQPNVIIVFDRVKTAAGTTQTWQAATPVEPTISGNRATLTNAGHSLAITRIQPAAADASVYDYQSDSDFSGGYRLDEQVPGGDNRFLHVMSVDGGATSASAAGENAVTVNLAGGGTATVTFARNDVGATLVLNGTTTTLGATMQTLAE